MEVGTKQRQYAKLAAICVPCLLLVAWGYIRFANSLGEDQVEIHRSSASGQRGVIAFRMDEPFTVVIDHVVRDHWEMPEPTGAFVNNSPIHRDVEVARFESKCDWLRGGYIATVYCSVENGEAVLQSNSRTIRVSPVAGGGPIGRTISGNPIAGYWGKGSALRLANSIPRRNW
jgi:hypothetical protein